jgi:lipoprotein-anchoring transpeptidase ErfK/SrfK
MGSPVRGIAIKSGRLPVLAKLPPGKGCPDPWYQLAPEAWGCSGWLLPRKDPPSAVDELLAVWRPGPYVGVANPPNRAMDLFRWPREVAQGKGQRVRGLAGFEARTRILVGRKPYLVTRTGLVAAEAVTAFSPTSLVGLTPVSAIDLPAFFALRDTALLRRGRDGALAPTGRTLPRYAVRSVPVRSQRGDAADTVVLEGGLEVARADVAWAPVPPPPPAGVGAAERWVDVDAAERLVYARQGARVARVMLTSLAPNTPEGEFRVEQKILWKDMTVRGGKDPFYLEAVPYVVFFRGDFAFHGAYWHDAFGTRLSHGCLNLPLADAQFLFEWLAPGLPPGFLSIFPTATDLGGRVRVRGKYRFRAWESPPPRR